MASSTDIRDLASTLLSRVQCEVQSMTNESIVDIELLLEEVIATLRAGRNSRLPIFRLPIETLHQVLENIALPLSEMHGTFLPFWRSHAKATWMLSPILRTCQTLRRIALSHANLWKTVSSWSRYRLPALPLYGAFDSDVPLVVIINGIDHENLLDESEALDLSRIQELHVLNLRTFRDRDDVAALGRHFRGAKLSCLESLSITSIVATGEDPISLDEAPRLKHLVLHSVTFLPQSTLSNLTHLALESVYEHGRHAMTADLLSRCPNLESLAIQCSESDQAASVPVPHPLSRPLAFNRLQRVSLQLPDILDDLGKFYLSLFPISTLPRNVPIALQIMYQRWDNASSDLGTLLMHATRSAASHLYLSMTPFVDPRFQAKLLVSISAVGPQGTFHLATLPFHAPNTFTAAPGWDNAYATFLGSILGDSSSFSAVREVWISGVYPEAHYHTRIAAAFREAIAGLQALETFVLVEPPRSYPHAAPTISLCPDAQGSAPVPPNLRTLRLVCEDGAHWGRSGGGNRLSLSVLLAELETGAYAYFDTLVLELRSWLDVTPEDLVQLKGHFATVTRLYADRSPTRPLPDYCVEPCGGPGGTGTLLGSLW